MSLAQRPSKRTPEPQFHDLQRPKLAALALLMILAGIALALVAVLRG
jgi:hypothetical protein